MPQRPIDDRRRREHSEDLLQALRHIQAGIDSLVKLLHPSHKSRETTGQEQTPKEYCEGPPLATIRVIAELNDAQNRQSAAENAKHYRLQRKSLGVQVGLLVATIAAFGAAAYYALVARQQKNTMDKTLQQVIRQTEAAQVTAKAAQDANLITRRGIQAYFQIHPSFRSTVNPYAYTPFWNVFVFIDGFNRGKSTARNVRIYTSIHVQKLGNGMPFGRDLAEAWPSNDVEPGDALIEHRFDTRQISKLAGAALLEELKRDVITVRSEIRYDAGFGVEEVQRFCDVIVWIEIDPNTGFVTTSCSNSDYVINKRRRELGLARAEQNDNARK